MALVTPANAKKSTIRNEANADLVSELAQAPVLRPGQTALGSSEEQPGLEFDGGIKTAHVADEDFDEAIDYLGTTFPNRGSGGIDFSEEEELPEGVSPEATVVLEGRRDRPVFFPNEELPDDSPFAGFTPAGVQEVIGSAAYQANLDSIVTPLQQQQANARSQAASISATRRTFRKGERAAREAVAKAETKLRRAEWDMSGRAHSLDSSGRKVFDDREGAAYLARSKKELEIAQMNSAGLAASQDAARKQMSAASIGTRQTISSTKKLLENAEMMAFQQTSRDINKARQDSLKFAQSYAKGEIDLQRAARREEEAVRAEEERPQREAEEAEKEKRDTARERLKDIREQIKSLSSGDIMENNSARIAALRKKEDKELAALGIGIEDAAPESGAVLTQEEYTAKAKQAYPKKSDKEIEEGYKKFLVLKEGNTP